MPRVRQARQAYDLLGRGVLSLPCRVSSQIHRRGVRIRRAPCFSVLPDYMVPEAVRYRDDLPRTPRGKIDYRALETEAQNA